VANAFIGIPQAYSLVAPISGQYPADNFTNDEPGLIFRSNAGVANVTFNLDLPAGSDPIGAMLLLGAPSAGYSIRWLAATTATNRTNGVWTYDATTNGSMSANRSADDAKYLHVPGTAQNYRFWRVVIYYDVGHTLTGTIEFWRLLLLKKIQPPDNIEVGATIGIDDRSERRYARGGRRNIDPVGIFPSFSGSWPWLDAATFRNDFRPLIYKRGATYPVAFVFDSDETTWGEDEIFYGDLEKNQSLTYEDGYLFSYSFSIVSLAP
jgi:hypothetical protein